MIPENCEEEIFQTIFENDTVKIERIVSYGQSSPVGFWYEQERVEFVILLKGEAEILFEERKKELKEGDYILIPPYKRHRVSFTSNLAVWLTIFFEE